MDKLHSPLSSTQNLNLSWTTQEDVNKLFKDLDDASDDTVSELIEQIVNVNVEFFIEAVTGNSEHLCDLAWQDVEGKPLKDDVVQKILKASFTLNKNQYQQLALYNFLLKTISTAEPLIKNLHVMVEEGIIPKMTREDFKNWKRENKSFYLSIFSRMPYQNDDFTLQVLKANIRNLAGIYYGFTQSSTWWEVALKTSKYSFLLESVSKIYPFFGVGLKSKVSFNVKLIELDHRVLKCMDTVDKTNEFFYLLFFALNLEVKIKRTYGCEQRYNTLNVLKRDEPEFFLKVIEFAKKNNHRAVKYLEELLLSKDLQNPQSVSNNFFN